MADTADNLVQVEPVKNLLAEKSTNLRDHFPFVEIRGNQGPTLDKLAAWSQSPDKFFILEGPTGFGKCFAPNTPVLMYDGTIKFVRDIQVGEFVMGDDSTPREVLSLHHGFSQMYDVVPIKGDKYTVNSAHILSLKFTTGFGTKGTYTNNQSSQVPYYRKLGIKITPKGTLDIPVTEFLALSKSQKHLLKGYRTRVQFVEQPITVDPYFLGLWLGDGDSDRPAVTTAEPEIVGFLHNYANALGLKVNSQFHNNAYTMDLNTGEVGGYPATRTKGYLLEGLRRLDLLHNKHIPNNYKCNSRGIRLHILAGLIDSDGHHIVRGGYEFIFKSERLAGDVTYLCRSLGFAAYMKPCEKTCTNAKNGPRTGKYWRVLMSGVGVEGIPSLLTRKQSKPRKQKKDVLVTGIKIVSTGYGEFFGFAVSGNGRFLLGDFTVVHNSPVDIAMASYAKTMPGYSRFEQGAYILTPQKTLAEQYMTDFAPMGLVELKGRSNYRCDKWQSDCETGAALNESSGLEEKCGYCPYKVAKEHFISTAFGTTNFAYYLNETNHSGQLPNRNILILDEGHNTEDQILSLTNTELNQKKCDEYGAGTLPKFDAGDNDKVLQWLDNVFVPAASAHSSKLARAFKEARDEERIKVVKKQKALERFLGRINMFRDSADPGEWFVWSDWSVNERTGKAYGTGDLFIKPLTARLFADDLLFSKAQKVLITSATILDFGTFMRNLGIDKGNAQTLAVNSEFPIENRPIFYTPVGAMSYNNIDATLPKMAMRIEEILTKHISKKGIVHTNSYKVNKYIVDYLRSTSHAFRVITHDNSKGAREAAQAKHLASTEPTVLFSPSMTEGLDLKGDLSRFQIVCKVPYPALDPYTRARMNRDKQWYQWQTALKLVQGTGRSVRSKTDRAVTYILDADFAQFIMKNNRVLPKYWTDAIIW